MRHKFKYNVNCQKTKMCLQIIIFVCSVSMTGVHGASCSYTSNLGDYYTLFQDESHKQTLSGAIASCENQGMSMVKLENGETIKDIFNIVKKCVKSKDRNIKFGLDKCNANQFVIVNGATTFACSNCRSTSQDCSSRLILFQCTDGSRLDECAGNLL